jgi:hypothetical protein
MAKSDEEALADPVGRSVARAVSTANSDLAQLGIDAADLYFEGSFIYSDRRSDFRLHYWHKDLSRGGHHWYWLDPTDYGIKRVRRSK